MDRQRALRSIIYSVIIHEVRFALRRGPRSPHFLDYFVRRNRGWLLNQSVRHLRPMRLLEQAELRQRDVETPHSQSRRAKGCNYGSRASWPRPPWLSVYRDDEASGDRSASVPGRVGWRFARLRP